MATFVISQIEKGNWQVQANDGEPTSGFKNWVEAETFARTTAAAVGGQIVRLSAKDRRVVSHLTPRATTPACARRDRPTDAAIVAALAAEAGVTLLDTVESVTNDIGSHDDETAAEIASDGSDARQDLEALSTADLVALYNAHGGNIQGKFKGARRTLIEKILNAA